jgi:RNA polymerase sigma-70 factor (ECF subfamily)
MIMRRTHRAHWCCTRNASLVRAFSLMMPASPTVRKATPDPGPEAVVNRTILVLDAYERHGSELLGFLVRATRDRALAEDVLQETFLRLVREARAGRSPTDPRAWLFRVAANQVVSAARRRATVAKWAPFLGQRGPDAASSLDVVLGREARDRVEAALVVLSPDARTAILLAAHGLGTVAVAAAIGRTELATRSLLCRARLRLREHLAEEEKR